MNSKLFFITNPTLNSALILFITLIAMSCSKKENSLESPSSTAVASNVQADIHTAVITDNLDALRNHVKSGANLNEKDPFGGSSPLISACVFGKTEAAKILIDAGADINFQNNDGSTPLHTAAFFCRPEIVKMLLEKGADKTIKNKFGVTAYESVIAPFTDVKNAYDMMGQMLSPMGLKLDYPYLEKTRPVIADMLK